MKISAFILPAVFLIPIIFAQGCGSSEKGDSFGSNLMSRDPIGESATYEVVRGNRTTGLIQGGRMMLYVLPGRTGNEEYKVHVQWDLTTSVVPLKSKTFFFIPKIYYTEEFWSKLRTERHFENSDVKIDYLSREGDNDKLKFYGFDSSGDVANTSLTITSNIENAPAIGAVKIDSDCIVKRPELRNIPIQVRVGVDLIR